ncbi:MAG: DNA-binding protein WhiA [Oscillospiraceae bacterium]|jgi:DNA-binding transcriptional regulator WhiA|nr:DNA-binding protein WhiA [Oscillospiraceae bacterium]
MSTSELKQSPSKSTFSARVKADLCAGTLPPCCQASMLYGLLLFGRKYRATGIQCTTENADVAACAAGLFRDVFSLDITPEQVGKRKFALTVDAPHAGRVLEHYGGAHVRARAINYAVPESCSAADEAGMDEDFGGAASLTGCHKAFLAGVYLSCGSCAEPERQYHLEFAVPYERLADSLARFLEELDAPPGRVRRGAHGSSHVLYYKDNEHIADLLALMGAVGASLELAEIAITKTLRNMANRQTNSDAANLNRAAEAAVRQLAAIRALAQSGTLTQLPAALQEAARLRSEHPEASLSELCALGNVSRSGLYARLQKLVALADK